MGTLPGLTGYVRDADVSSQYNRLGLIGFSDEDQYNPLVKILENESCSIGGRERAGGRATQSHFSTQVDDPSLNLAIMYVIRDTRDLEAATNETIEQVIGKIRSTRKYSNPPIYLYKPGTDEQSPTLTYVESDDSYKRVITDDNGNPLSRILLDLFRLHRDGGQIPASYLASMTDQEVASDEPLNLPEDSSESLPQIDDEINLDRPSNDVVVVFEDEPDDEDGLQTLDPDSDEVEYLSDDSPVETITPGDDSPSGAIRPAYRIKRRLRK